MDGALLYDFNGVRTAFMGRLPDQIVILFRYLIKLGCRNELIFIILEDLGTKIVAVSVAHTLFGNLDFHARLLLGLNKVAA